MKIIITSGGTSEKIDEVRKITNMSTGSLGSKIAENLMEDISNIEIFFVTNKDMILPQGSSKIKFKYIDDTNDVLNTMKEIISENKIDFVIHSMAISDYTVDKIVTEDVIKDVLDRYLNINNRTVYKTEDMYKYLMDNIYGVDNSKKISSNNNNLFLNLVKTPKIVDLIKKLDNNIELISFKLLNGVTEEELIEVATKQLKRTNSSVVIANDLVNINDNGKWGEHKAFAIEKNNEKTFLENKKQIAIYLTDFIKRKYNETHWTKKEIFDLVVEENLHIINKNKETLKTNNRDSRYERVVFNNLVCATCGSPIYTTDCSWFECSNCRRVEGGYTWANIKNPNK